MINEKTESLPMPLSKDDTKSIPSTIGVYYFVSDDKILYIGKSVNLKARILSHIENAKIDPKEAAIISNSTAVHYTISDSEFKALLFESQLIKKYLPNYNSIWRDDKSYLYLKITTKDEYPKIFPIRRENDGKSRYFGPFQSMRVINEVLKEIRRVFPYCTQKQLGKKPCFYAKINLCKPCPNEINQMTGEDKENNKRLYRYNIRQIVKVFEGNTDLVLKSLYKELKRLTKEKKYEDALILRNKVNRFERLVHMPLFSSRIEEQYDTSEESMNELVKILRHYFPGIETINRVECFDMSNISFTDATASMVVFTNGQVDKSQYRKFKIKNKKANSDFAMISEVIQRRFRNNWPRPDLLVIDGGRPQVKTVMQTLSESKITIPVIGIAKHPDRLIIGVDNLPLVRPSVHNLGFNMIRAIRDESHRFAKKYHIFLRNKRVKDSTSAIIN